MAPSFAQNRGHSDMVADVHACVKKLKSEASGSVGCCELADGEDATWQQNPDDTYSVRIKPAADQKPDWFPVPPKAIIQSADTCGLRYAMVWWSIQRDLDGSVKPKIRCFIPGTRS